MLKKVEIYIIELIKGQRKGIISFFLKGLLLVASCFFQLGVACRNWAFEKGWLRRYSPPVPLVISIGNIVAGGTGKTPVTMAMAQQFADEFTVAILSRGYRSQAERMPHPLVLSRGDGPLYPSEHCGDEPYLLAQNVSKAFVIVGRDRHQASNIAAKEGAQLILLDDGLQHRGINRDYEIIVVDARDPYGKGYFLPRGLLRDPVSALQRADLIVLNHVEDSQHFAQLKQDLSRYTRAAVVGTKMRVTQIQDLNGNVFPSLSNKKVGMFCGIANPNYFHATLTELGADVVEQYCVADHTRFDPIALRSFSEKALGKGAEWLVCTEKDFVRLEKAFVLHLPIAWVQACLEVVAGESAWTGFIQKTKADLKSKL